MEVGRMGCQQIDQDLCESCGVKRAEGFKELGGKGRVKDIGMDVLLKESEKILKIVPPPAVILCFGG